MTNHYHLVIETPEGNLAKGMRQLNGVYTQIVNRAHGRVGLPSAWDGLQGQIYLGSEAFIERIQSNLSPEQSLDEIPRKQRRPLDKPLAECYRESVTPIEA